ncbi:hypothetical protein ESA94_00390 [Lacibacter luteus]|uniref:Glycosyltransferase RgtA/B/C/D-like domain-containing protein n=1 Tax=Lacibacter luteus TaxID=2508719 RepID=A0A4Q1CKN2_9BACT|nr:hypothetical protein [Lacibacter luteus]RXK61513.1 hypothetical protein ESA94_00390 [Lacibacter luteus]
MNLLIKQRLPFSLATFCILFAVTWPLYQYVSDLDAIGYMEVAHHYLKGEWKLAVNGFWNPLHSWLVLPLLKLGLNDWTAFKISNLFFSLGSLYVLHSLLNKFELSLWLKAAIQYCSIIILLHYCYFELAADALLVFLLLCYFNLIKQDDFYTSTGKNILAGFIGAMLYFAKSYGFPFFIFHFVVIHLLFNRLATVKQLLIGLLVFAVCIFPWLYALHWKYGEWMIAFGKFNAHWQFGDAPLPGPILHPPPHEGSSSVWEDPWHMRADNLASASLLTLVLHQIRVVLFNFQQWLKCIHELSFLASAILFLSGYMYFKQRSKQWLYLLVGMLVLPSGYLLLHLETRFIWVTTFIFFIAGALLLQQLTAVYPLRKLQQLFMWLIFFGSFLIEPINLLKDQIHHHKNIFEAAAEIKEQHIQGRFTSNQRVDECMVYAYLSNNPYYTIYKPTYAVADLITELKQNKIRYYFYYYSTQQDKEEFLKGSIAATGIKQTELLPSLLVIQLY